MFYWQIGKRGNLKKALERRDMEMDIWAIMQVMGDRTPKSLKGILEGTENPPEKPSKETKDE